MIDMRNHGNVANILLLAHGLSHQINVQVHLEEKTRYHLIFILLNINILQMTIPQRFPFCMNLPGKLLSFYEEWIHLVDLSALFFTGETALAMSVCFSVHSTS